MDFCVYPIVNNIQGKVSDKLCNCSEKFAEQMFSKVCQKNMCKSKTFCFA